MEDNKDIKDTNIKEANSFVKYRGKINQLYSDEIALKNRLGKTPKGFRADIKNKDAKQLYYAVIENPEKGPEISEAAYYISNPYAAIIDYYKTFFYIRYTITPQIARYEKFKDETGHKSEDYAKIYSRMVEKVEGISLETIIPEIIEETLIKGSCAIITEKNTKTDALVTTFLPTKYFKKIGKTQFGTNIVAFDYKYFKDLKVDATGANTNKVDNIDFDGILKSMPLILQEGYVRYEEDNARNRWQALDPKSATVFQFNEKRVPPKLGAFPASIDYSNYKDIELANAANQLNKILTHQIPTNPEGDLILSVDESIEVAREIRNALSTIPNLKLITTFGKTELHDLQKDQSENMKVVDSAYQHIYSSAGVDYNIFISDKDLEASLKRDKAFIWSFLEGVMKFYNVAFNNIYNFNPYQAYVKLLPITVQSEDKEVKNFIEYAGAGIGRLQAIVASGIKQSDIKSNYELEEFLDLDTILKPLQSMYTSSYKANQNKDANSSDKDKNESEQDRSKQTEEKEDSNVDKTVK